jgi:hypothetical protein
MQLSSELDRERTYMGKNWRDCIIVFFDLAAVKSLAPQTGAGSSVMRKLHALAANEVPRLVRVNHAYVWNDSVLLLGFVDKTRDSFVKMMREADSFKRAVDAIKTSYAVAVKGQTFPVMEIPETASDRVTVLQASSWAMANCFEIEKKLGKLRAAWYVDGRIARKLRGTNQSKRRKVALLPSGQRRTIHTYFGYLWNIAV